MVQDLATLLGDERAALIALIQRAPLIDGTTFNPTDLVAVVNQLLPRGFEPALAALTDYLNLANDHELCARFGLDTQRLFLIARLLCVRRDGQPEMPPVLLGTSSPPAPSDRHAWPLFPLALRDDLPLLLVEGYILLGGLEQSPADHLDYCRTNCELRALPLTPVGDPVAIAVALTESPEWAALVPTVAQPAQRAMLIEQGRRAAERTETGH